MYEWITVMVFTLNPSVQHSDIKKACYHDPRNSFVLQAQDIPVLMGKDTKGRNVMGRSGRHRLRILPVKCSGNIEARIDIPKEEIGGGK